MNSRTDEKKKTQAIIALAANFEKKFSEELLDLWLKLLSGYTVQHVHAAIKHVLESYEYKTMPPFAVIKKALDLVTGDDEETLKAQAEAEWCVLQNKIEEIGAYGKPELHETTAYTVRQLGGWNAACHWPLDSLAFKRRDFLDIWRRSHGKTKLLRLGANAVQAAVTGRLAHISQAFDSLPGGRSLDRQSHKSERRTP